MSLRGRFIVLALLGVLVAWPWYWATTGSPQARKARARIARSSDCRLEKDSRGHVKVVKVKVSVSKYPANWRHMMDARNGRNTGPDGTTVVNDGLKWPTVLVKNNVGEQTRRAAGEALSGLKAKAGLARDEYPPAEGRSTNAADFRYVDRRQNSAQGASMGNQLRQFCDGQPYKLVAAP